MMTKMEILKHVAEFLLKQNKKALDNTGSCCYRVFKGDEVLCCAAGSLIKDEFYDEAFEGCSLSSFIPKDDADRLDKQLKLRSALINSGMDMEDPEIVTLIRRLQNIHDQCEPEDWEHNLRDLESELVKFGTVRDVV